MIALLTAILVICILVKVDEEFEQSLLEGGSGKSWKSTVLHLSFPHIIHFMITSAQHFECLFV